jgi:hypothetical protein
MKRIYEYGDDNPLAKYYNKLVKKNKNKRVNNWRILGELTGVPTQTVISVARKSEQEVLKMEIGTYLKIKNSIGVDMLKFNNK